MNEMTTGATPATITIPAKMIPAGARLMSRVPGCDRKPWGTFERVERKRSPFAALYEWWLVYRSATLGTTERVQICGPEHEICILADDAPKTVRYIADTSVWQSYRVTITLTDAVPEILGYSARTLAIATFQPETIEVVWTRRNGSLWDLYEMELRDKPTGHGGHFRKVRPDEVAEISWLSEIISETAPNNN